MSLEGKIVKTRIDAPNDTYPSGEMLTGLRGKPVEAPAVIPSGTRGTVEVDVDGKGMLITVFAGRAGVSVPVGTVILDADQVEVVRLPEQPDRAT